MALTVFRLRFLQELGTSDGQPPARTDRRPEAGEPMEPKNREHRRYALVVAAVPIFFELHLGPHLDLLEDLGFSTHMASSGPPQFDRPFDEVPFSRRVSAVTSHLKAIRTMRTLMTNYCKRGPLLLHVHTPIAAALARLAIPRRLRSDITVVYMAHGLHFLPGQKSAFQRVERMLANRTDCIIVMNSDDAKSAHELGIVRVESVPGVGCTRLAFRDPRTVSSETQRVALIGVLEDRKRPLLAVAAIAHLAPSVQLDVYGSGPLEQDMRELAKDLGVTDRVHFKGWTDDLTEAYSTANCLLFPSAQEGLPMAVVEAIGAALPIVAFDIRGVRDILEGLDDWYIPSDTEAAAVASSVRAALSTDVDASALHERAMRYTVPNAVAAHRAILTDLMGPRG